MDIAIDIGTSNTSVFVTGNGVVLHEPSRIAYNVSKGSKKIIAVGQEAYKMVGKAPDTTAIVSPIVDGVIADTQSASQMLGEFLKKVIPTDTILPVRVKAILAIPTGLKREQRRAYEEVVFNANRHIKQVTLIESVILSAVGVGLPIASAEGGLVANIGGGSTEIAAMSLSGIIAGCGLSLGGELMDKAITDMIAAQHNVKLGISKTKRVKEKIASLYTNDLSLMPANGIDVSTKSLSSVTIKANELYSILHPYYVRVGDAIESILNMCPPDAGAEFNKKGVYVVGGAAKISGLTEMLSKKIGAPVIVPEFAEYATITGGGRLLSDKELLKSILSR